MGAFCVRSRSIDAHAEKERKMMKNWHNHFHSSLTRSLSLSFSSIVVTMTQRRPSRRDQKVNEGNEIWANITFWCMKFAGWFEPISHNEGVVFFFFFSHTFCQLKIHRWQWHRSENKKPSKYFYCVRTQMSTLWYNFRTMRFQHRFKRPRNILVSLSTKREKKNCT